MGEGSHVHAGPLPGPGESLGGSSEGVGEGRVREGPSSGCTLWMWVYSGPALTFGSVQLPSGLSPSFVCELSAQRGNAFDVLPENFADIDTIFSIVVSVTLVFILLHPQVVGGFARPGLGTFSSHLPPGGR